MKLCFAMQRIANQFSGEDSVLVTNKRSQRSIGTQVSGDLVDQLDRCRGDQPNFVTLTEVIVQSFYASRPKPWLDFTFIDLINKSFEFSNRVTLGEGEGSVLDVCHFGILFASSDEAKVLPHKAPDVSSFDIASGKGNLAKENGD